MTDFITTPDVQRLQELEEVIAPGLETFIAVGEALSEIRESKLWKAADFDSFEQYLQVRWNFKSSRARQLISGARVARLIEETAGVTIRNENQAREMNSILRHYPDAVQELALQGLSKRGGELTPERLQAELDVLEEYHDSGTVTAANGEQNALTSAIKLSRREHEIRRSMSTVLLDTTGDIARRYNQEDGDYIVFKVEKGMAALLTAMNNVRVIIRTIEQEQK